MDLKQLFFKSNPIVDEFKEMIKNGIVKNEEMNDSSIEQCVIYWLDHFYQIPKDEISKYQMKQESTIFLKNLLSLFSKSLKDNSLNQNYVLCLDSLSLFVPLKDDCNTIFLNFIISIFDLTISIENKYQIILSNFLKALLASKTFQLVTIKQDNLLHFWSTGLNRPPSISEIIFDFLTETVRQTNQKKVKILTDPFQQLMIQSLKDANKFALRFLCFCYNLHNDYIKLFEDHFSDIIDAIVRCDDGLCFNDLLYVKTHDSDLSLNAFNELSSSNSLNMVKSLLAVVNQNRSKIHFQIVMFLGSLSFLDREGQYLFLSLISDDIVDLLFPPRLSHADCACLAVFCKTKVNQEKAIKYLNATLFQTKKEAIKDNFDKELHDDFEKKDGFNDLIICLLSKLDAFDPVCDYFTSICYAQTPKIIPCLDVICQSFPPISFLQQLVENAEILKNIGFFKSKFPFILRENMASLTRELLKNKLFVEFIINNEQYEVLQALSSDGPHPIIDKLLLATDIPKKLSQEQIKSLIYDLPLNLNDKTDLNEENVRFLAYKEKKMIRIPGLIPYLKDIEFNSLFDQSVAAQYLISNEFIHIDDPLFSLLGKQFLTPKCVNEIITTRIDVLDNLTKDDHSLHKSVFQFKKGQNNSFISFDLPAIIEFKVDPSFKTKNADYRDVKHLLLCTFSEFSIFVSSNNQIIYSSSNNFIKSTDSFLDCDLDKWHILKISKVNALHFNVIYDGVSFYPSNFEVNINKKLSLDSNIMMINSLLVVGSPLLNPISTFYIHINRSNKIIQMGDGIVTANYRGIYYYKSILNIENRLLKSALQTNDEEQFSHIVMSLIRFAVIKRKKYHNASLSASNLNKIRQLFIIKHNFLSQKLLNDILSEFTDFNLYEALNSLIDYDLWRSVDFTPAFNFIYNLFMLDVSPTCSLTPKNNDKNQHSLLNNYLSFFLDLCEYSNDKKYFDMINKISTLFSFSGDLIYRFLEYPEFCDFFFEKNSSLLIKMIPLKYIVYLSNKTALLYLDLYSLSHTTSVNSEYISQSDFDILISQTSFYSNFSNEKSFWNSIVTLLYGQSVDVLSTLNPDLVIKNEPILKIIFSLIPHLAQYSIQEYEKDKNNSVSKLFYSVTELVKTLFANNKISDVNVYLKELVGMIRMNCFATQLTPLPIIFETFESERKALSASGYLPNINENLIRDIINNSKQIPTVDPVSFSYFGIEIPYQKDDKNRKKNYDEYERYFDHFESFEFQQVFEIIIILIGLFDDDMKKTELLRCLFSCGIDSSTKTSMDFHQNFVMRYLERVGISHAILTVLNEALLVGYWENNLLLLFDIVIKSYMQRISYPTTVIKKTKVQEALEIENDILVFELIMRILILLNRDDFNKIPKSSIDFIKERLRKLQNEGSDHTSAPDKNRFSATYLHYTQCISGIIDLHLNEPASTVDSSVNKSSNPLDNSDKTDDGTDINDETTNDETYTTNNTNDDNYSNASIVINNSSNSSSDKSTNTNTNNKEENQTENNENTDNNNNNNNNNESNDNNENNVNNNNNTNDNDTNDSNNNNNNNDNTNENIVNDNTINNDDDNVNVASSNKFLDNIIITKVHGNENSQIGIASTTDTTDTDSIRMNMNSTNYSFLSSSTFGYDPNLINGFEDIHEFLRDYKKSTCSLIRELNLKYIELRIRTVLSHYDVIYLAELKQKKKDLSDNVRYLFEKRYNFYAQRNEETYYEILTNLPKDQPTQYQIASTVHPFSPPTLYVPYYSKCNCDNFKIYPRFYTTLEELLSANESREDKSKDNKKVKKDLDMNIFGALCEKVPRILYYNYNFSSYSFNMNHNEYVEFFIHYESQIESIVDISLITCADTISSVLIRNKEHFMIVTYAKTVEGEKNKFTLIDPKMSLLRSVFLDICFSGFYGKTTLFFGHLVLIFDREEITISIPRIFCFQRRAIEIWFERGYSLYLIFSKEEDFDNEWNQSLSPMKMLPYSESIFSLSFSSHITNSVKNKSDLVKFRIQWVNNRISSFAYLLILNFYADRSFTNICQYFVMPWIQEGRDLSKPMGMQDEQRGNDFREKYRTSFPDSHFYGSLYSSPAIVMRFMVRVQPFTNFSMDLQNGFDKADRLFFDIDNEYQSASSKSNHNVEELIPELFMLPEIYLNVNKIPFPKRMRGQTINDCDLPSSNSDVNNWIQFVWEHRKKLDDTPHLEKWIDLIFGVYSRGQNAIDKENLFYPSTYGIRPQFIDDHAFQSLMMNFGQVPTQLFYEEHPSKNTLIFSRWPLLTETDSISFQRIHSNVVRHDYQNEKDNMNSLTLVKSNGTLVVKSCMSIFEDVSHHKIINYGDDDELDTSQFHCCSFSVDQFFFCIVFESGTIFVYRAICELETKISYFKHLSICYLPETEANFVSLKATCVTASSHLFLVCEVIDRFIFCFQINGTFIRTIPCSTPVNKVMINDSYQSIFAVQDYQIEVFTINGTKIASINTIDTLPKYKIAPKNDHQEFCKILSSSISLNDTSIYLATGHKNGLVVLWTIDPKLKILCIKKIIHLDSKLVIDVNQNKLLNDNDNINNNSSTLQNDLVKNDLDVVYVQVVSNGSGLYALCEKHIDNNNEPEKITYLLTARETHKPLVAESAVLECAGCGKKNDQNPRKKFIACNSCGAYFCNDCIQKSGGEAVCHDCLTHIAEYSDVIDQNV
ncbi:hypothetical protein M9Y10_009070 [Tritrichomonas musculus]|uniref:BEACH domain-containing protein n=1 Tax=Tritrichomonas musculus TaxID=1915356 RepID=A0ABR2J0N1_9EUKA